tara:strand:- start:939 stop:2006 length:1068 start_codon:yes stop_codon:yes gene_type:complete
MSNQNDFNVWSKWDNLKKVMVGHCVAPEYFDHVANIEIKEKLQQLVIEAQEDLDNIAKVCGEQSVEVVRVNKEKFPKYLDPDQKAQGIQPVLYPRNRLSVLGQHLIFSDQHATSDGYFSEIITEDILQRNTPWHDLLIKNNIKFIDPPCWTLVGKDLFIDIDQWEVNDFVEYNPNSRNIIERWAQKWWPEVDIHWVEIGGHNDSCFHTVKPGAIISLDDIMTYTETFPGWEVCYLDDSNIGQLPEFMQAKQKTYGKYWIPGEEDNKELLDFVNSWLDSWLGYVEETVFDVNCMMLNEHTVLVSSYNKQVFDFFKKHKIVPIICPLRHRFFFDGGIHCVTQDLYREGECQSYIDYK